MQQDWELSQTLASLDGHGIRAACVLERQDKQGGNDACQVVAGTQGGGLVAYQVPSGHVTPIAYQHDHAVTALLANQSLYMTGCKDAVIRIFDAHSHTLQGTLEGHDKPVTSLSWCGGDGDGGSGSQYLVSGSWDGTAKVWNVTSRALIATLPGHENSVCVVGLPGRDAKKLIIATGSAGVAQSNVIVGHTVRIWTVEPATGQVELIHQVQQDHQGPIRGICWLDDSHQLATCSNDGTVKLRTPDTGAVTATLGFVSSTTPTHPPMLLGVTGVDPCHVVACAEDGTVVVWNLDHSHGEPQLLDHPACVWNVVALPNGDVATCGDDGHLRIFTRSADRMAPAAEREELAQQVAQARQKQSGGPSPQEVANLPHWETNLQQRGTSDGQVQLFQKNGVAIAAQWSMASQTWIEVGQVMGSREGGGMIDGVAYDHVLPIEVDLASGDVAKLRIGYNTGENPFVAAQRFMDAHMLPQHHLSEIADYIQQRVGQAAPTLGVGQAAANATAPVGATTGVPIASFQYLPIQVYQTFDLSEKTAMLGKIKNKIESSGELSPSQLECIESLVQKLADTSRYHACQIDQAELLVLSFMLEHFEPAEAFPALDLARLVVLVPDCVTRERLPYWTQMIQLALAMTAKTDGQVAVPMLSLRLFANALKSESCDASLLEPILACCQRFVSSSNKNIRLSVATVFYNVCFHLSKGNSPPSPELIALLIPLAHEIIISKAYEGQAMMRTLLGLGTICLSSNEAKEAAKGLYLASKVEPAASPHGEQVKAAAKEVYAVLS